MLGSLLRSALSWLAVLGAAGCGGSGAAAPDYRTKSFAGEAERSGKRGYCAAFNEALPVQQRHETLLKVCALAFAFSAAHICTAQLVVLHRAQRCTALGATQRPALHCAQRFTAHSASLRTALHSAHSVAQCAAFYTSPIAASEPSIYKWWNISVSVQRLLRSNGTRPCKSCKLAHARAFVFPR